MDVAAATVRAHRLLLVALVAITPLVFRRGGFEVFQLPKATVVLFGAVLAVGLAAVRTAARRGRLELPARPVLLAVGAFCFALLLVTATSSWPWQSFVGGSERYTGAASYLAYAALLVLSVPLIDRWTVDRLIDAALLSGALIALYGLLQWLGHDPLAWTSAATPVFSTQGNSNFLAGYLAVLTPLAVATALRPRGPVIRTAAAVVAMLFLLVATVSRSTQGPLAAAVGLSVLAAVWFSARRSRDDAANRPPTWLLVTGAGGVFVVTSLLIRYVGTHGGGGGGIATRREFWRVGMKVFAAHPAVGTGLDSFGNFYARYRGPRLDASEFVDAPHNVPLAMFVGGGLILGVAYLVFIAIVAASGIRAVRAATGEQLLVAGGLIAAWLAYMTQAFVSIDVPALALLHWTLAACLIAMASPAWSAMPAGPARGKGGRRRPRSRRAGTASPPATALAAVAAVVFVLVGSVAAVRPLRADADAFQTERLARASRFSEAEPHAARAVRLVPWRGRYWFLRASVFEVLGHVEEAEAAAQRAADLEPGNYRYVLRVAKMFERRGALDEADNWYRRASMADPRNPEVLLAVGQWDVARNRLDDGLKRLRAAAALLPNRDFVWLALAQAEQKAQHDDAAAAAYARVLALDPTNREATEFLARRTAKR